MTRLLLALAVLTGCAGPAAAQKARPLDGNGFDAFAGLLHYHGLTPATVGEFAATPPADRVLVFLAARYATAPRLDDLARRTLAGGGSVLWAVDGGLDLGAVLQDGTRLTTSFGVAVTPPGVPALNDDRESPFLVPRRPSGAERALVGAGLQTPDPAGLLFAGLARVATSAPGLVTDGPAGGGYAWAELADLPDGTVAARAEASRRRRPPLVVAASTGSGAKTHRALVVANSRAFANRLLAAEEADNLAFANSVVVWLSAGGRRKTCLLVVNGVAVERFDAVTFQEPPPVPPLPPLPDLLDPAVQKKLTDLANETLGKLEATNAFNRLVTNGEDLTNPDRLSLVLRTVAVIVGAFVLALVLRRLLGAKHAPDHTPVPRDPARPGGADGAAKQRQELVQRGEYLGLVAEYLRGWFAECGAAAGAALPEIRVRPGVPDKPLRDALRILWGVAFDPPAPGRGGRAARRAVPYSRWKQLEPTIHAAQAAHTAGDWRFAEPKEPA